MLEAGITPFSIQDLLYFPVIIFSLTVFFNRDKFQWLDRTIIYITSRLDSNYKKFFFFLCNILIALVMGYFISFITFPVSDVDNAMVGAILAFSHGTNPYSTNIVPHIFQLSKIHSTQYSTYNYGPIDLICYSLGYFIFSPFVGNSWWLFYSNVILSCIIYLLIIKNMFSIPDSIKIFPYIFLISWFLQDNVILMLFFLALAWWVHIHVSSKYRYPLVITILTIGVFTKLYVAFVLFGYFVYIFKDDFTLWISNMIISLFTTLLIIVPFGIWNVIKSLFVFQIDLSIRSSYATIQGGIPRYLDLVHLSWINFPLSLLLVIFFVFISQRYNKDQINVKFIIFTVLTLTLLPVSGYEFFIVPGFFGVMEYYQYISLNFSNPIENIEKIDVKNKFVSIS